MKSKTKSSKGLGDTIEKITEATGIKKLVHAIAGDDCGCEERKKKLNELFPYASGMDEEGRELYEKHLKDWRDWPRIELDKQQMMIQMMREYGGRKLKFTRCGSCLRNNFSLLENLYLNSCEDISSDPED